MLNFYYNQLNIAGIGCRQDATNVAPKKYGAQRQTKVQSDSRNKKT